MTVTITLAQLEAAHACAEARAAFAVTFPDGMPLDAEHIATALANPNGVEWLDWLVRDSGLCPTPLRQAYDAQRTPLRQAYDAQRATLREAFAAQVAPLREAFAAQVAPLWKAYDAQVDPLWKAYDAQVDPLWKAFDAQVDQLWEAFEAQRDILLTETLLAWGNA